MVGHAVKVLLAALASLAFSAVLLIAATLSPACAAELNLLGPASFRVLFPKLLPEFEKSSGHKVTAAYAPLGVITERVSKGEPVDVAIVSRKQNEELQKVGKLLAGPWRSLLRKLGQANPAPEAVKRGLFKISAGVALGGSQIASASAQTGGEQKTFVLVHGAGLVAGIGRELPKDSKGRGTKSTSLRTRVSASARTF